MRPITRLKATAFAAALLFTACTLRTSQPEAKRDLSPKDTPVQQVEIDEEAESPTQDLVLAEPENPSPQPVIQSNQATKAPKDKTRSGRISRELKKGSLSAIQGAPSAAYGLSGAGKASASADALRMAMPSAPPSHTRHELMDQDQAYVPAPEFNTEEYSRINENPFLEARRNPLSTFSIDVDAASYANVRRFLTGNQLPPHDAVRIEEMINYFDYDYPQPQGDAPFSITTEIAATPWNGKTKLVHIGLQGVKVEASKLPPSNLVFLIDVSGSMDSPEKLPLLKSAFRMLVEQLRPEDRIAMVVYAGAAGVVLPPTSGSDKATILGALERLSAGGSTAGGEGLLLAYQTAKQAFLREGNNRIILATDGDFNVGVSSDGELVRMIEEKRKTGVFLSVLGFGMGNYKDSKMEQLADKGNGNYSYIDNIMEARKVLVEEIGGTLVAIAKDVKLQIEFNPARVQAYRLVGYENRMLRSEDFNDDSKDAGELGAGHSVTALYEVVPTGAEMPLPSVDPLKYQKPATPKPNTGRTWSGRGEPEGGDEILTVKFRYKDPNGSKSKLLARALKDRNGTWENSSENFRFSAAAAGFGMLLRDSQHKGDLAYDQVIAMAKGAKGRDAQGHRAEFIRLAEIAKLLASHARVGARQPIEE